jgi:iron complex transport system substrate-binding protein
MDAAQKALTRFLTALMVCALVLSARATPAAAPLRIVSIVPAVTEMLFAIGAGPQVVGVSSFDHFPAAVEAVPRVGGLIDPDVEHILKLAPDLVIVYGAKSDLAARLSRAKIATYAYESGNLANVTATIRALGDRLGRKAEAEAEATRIERGLAAIRARVAGQPRYRTLLIFGREPGNLRGIYASGGYGFLHDLLEVAGGDDVFADVKRENVQVSTEQMLARAPEAIIELHEARTPQFLAAERGVWSQLPGLPAVKNNRVYLLSSEMLTIPGPRVVDAAKMMADALHPVKLDALHPVKLDALHPLKPDALHPVK